MSDQELTNITHHGSLWVLSLAGLAIVALVLGVGLTRERPVPVMVDGTPMTLGEGSTVSELKEADALTARPGRFLSVRGSVIETAGGTPVRVTVNGRVADDAQYIFRKDVLVSYDGSDTVEATVTVREPIPVKTRRVGSGPIMRLASPGAAGVMLNVVGEKSRELVSQRVLVPARTMVIVKTRPRPQGKLVALTFDDGPWPGQTDKILKILEKEGVHATFFMLGVRVQAAPELAREVAMAGNVIGSHSLGHRRLTTSKPKTIKKEIDDGAAVIYEATGVLPTWFRPPYGSMNDRVWSQVRLSRLKVALWDVDTRDWSRPGVKQIVKAATKDPKTGSIILMHDGGTDRKQTIKALPKVIKKYKKAGYTFVTIQELADAL